jgi:hypothetical protein
LIFLEEFTIEEVCCAIEYSLYDRIGITYVGDKREGEGSV